MADNFYSTYPAGSGSSGVSSLNGLTGALTLIAGSGITITPGAGTLTIASTGGSGANTALSNLTTTSINQPLQGAADLTLLAGIAPGSGPGYNVSIISGDSNDDAPGYINLTVGTGATGGGGIRMSTFSGGAGIAGDLWANIGDSGAGQWTNCLIASQQFAVSCVGDTDVNISSPSTTTFDGVDISSGVQYVLLINQTDPIENGIWYFDGLQLNRPTVYPNGKTIFPGAKFTVLAGGVIYGNTLWTGNLTLANVIIGTDPINFNEIGPGVNKQLSNLGTTNINANLLFDTDYNYDIGSSSKAANQVWTHILGSSSDLQIYANTLSITGVTATLNITTSGASSQNIDIHSGDSLGTGESSGDATVRTGDSDLDSGDIYLTTGSSTSGLQGRILTTARSLLIPQGSTDPVGVSAGEIYYNTVSNDIRFFDGSTWVIL